MRADTRVQTVVAMKNENEQIVLDFIHAAYGQSMDVDAMAASMAQDFVWQLHVPLSPVIVGREAARGTREAQHAVDGNDRGQPDPHHRVEQRHRRS